MKEPNETNELNEAEEALKDETARGTETAADAEHEASEAKVQNASACVDTPAAESEVSEADKLLLAEAKRAEEAEAKAKELQDRYVRTLAEYDNYRKRTTREKEQSFDRGVARLAEEILPVIDNLERALSSAKDPEDPMVKGVQMTYDSMLAALKNFSIEPMDDLGQTFDPHFHNAMQHIDSEEYGESEIVAVFQKGYKMGENVLRPSLVKVAN